MSALRDRLAAITATRPFEVAWHFIDLREGGELHRHGDASLPSTGTERLLLYLSCLRAVQRGQLDADAAVTYRARHRASARCGVLRWMTPGLTITISDALAQMIITGDGVGAALVRDELVSRDVSAVDLVNGFCADTGLVSTRCVDGDGDASPVPSGTTSAHDQALLVESLVARAQDARSRLDLDLDPPLAARALDVMSSVLATTGITAHLPGHGPFNAHVAHLPCDGGTGGGTGRDLADVGVVYQGGAPSYVLAAFCTGVPETIDGLPGTAATLATLGDLSAACWSRDIVRKGDGMS